MAATTPSERQSHHSAPYHPPQHAHGRYAIALDTETTGLNASQNHVIEIALRILDTTSGVIVDSYESVVELSDLEWTQANPDSLRFNGFTKQEMLEKGKPREEIAARISDIFQKHEIRKGSDFFLCQNPTFDRPFFAQLISEEKQQQLGMPYHWLDLASMNFALETKKIVNREIHPYFIRCGKDAIAQRQGLPPEEMPHRAMNGVDHMLLIYQNIVGFPTKTERVA